MMGIEEEFKICYLVIVALYVGIRIYFSVLVNKSKHKIFAVDKAAVTNEGIFRVILRIVLFSTRNVAIILYFLDYSQFFLIRIPVIIRIIGLILGTVSVIVLVHVQTCLGRFWSTSLTLTEDHRLIQKGLYKYIRHPMYLVLICIMIFHILVPANFLIMVPSAIAIINIYTRIGREEKMLIDHFGDDYLKYMKTTNKIIPNLLKVRGKKK